MRQEFSDQMVFVRGQTLQHIFRVGIRVVPIEPNSERQAQWARPVCLLERCAAASAHAQKPSDRRTPASSLAASARLISVGHLVDRVNMCSPRAYADVPPVGCNYEKCTSGSIGDIQAISPLASPELLITGTFT